MEQWQVEALNMIRKLLHNNNTWRYYNHADLRDLVSWLITAVIQNGEQRAYELMSDIRSTMEMEDD